MDWIINLIKRYKDKESTSVGLMIELILCKVEIEREWMFEQLIERDSKITGLSHRLEVIEGHRDFGEIGETSMKGAEEVQYFKFEAAWTVFKNLTAKKRIRSPEQTKQILFQALREAGFRPD